MEELQLWCGLDFAYANNGLVIIDKYGSVIESKVLITKSSMSDENRMLSLIDQLDSYLDFPQIQMVYLEGLSFGSKGRTVSQLGAVHYLTRIFLMQHNLQYKIITPTVLKKFVTGKGNSKKELILLNVYKKWGVEFDDNNLADAYSLARMALEGA